MPPAFMPTEREKMLAGELYDPLDPGLVAGRTRARDLCWTLNATRESEEHARRGILRQLFASGGCSAPRCRSTPPCTRSTPSSAGARSTGSRWRSAQTCEWAAAL